MRQGKKYLTLPRVLFFLWQLVWGFPQTLAGLVVLLANRKAPHVPFHGAVVTRWNHHGSLSLGPFIFLSDSIPPELVGHTAVHEYGHSIQSLFLGPLFLLVIGIPSLLWGELPLVRRWRLDNKVPYFSFYTEKFANYLGTKVTGFAAMQGL